MTALTRARVTPIFQMSLISIINSTSTRQIGLGTHRHTAHAAGAVAPLPPWLQAKHATQRARQHLDNCSENEFLCYLFLCHYSRVYAAPVYYELSCPESRTLALVMYSQTQHLHCTAA
jgi:hypothetical protein